MDTFLQIIPITKYIKAIAFLDTSSDAAEIKSKIAKNFKLNGDCENLWIIITNYVLLNNAISKTLELESKQVSFKVSCESHPNFADIEKAWVVSELYIKCKTINVPKLKENFNHLID